MNQPPDNRTKGWKVFSIEQSSRQHSTQRLRNLSFRSKSFLAHHCAKKSLIQSILPSINQSQSQCGGNSRRITPSVSTKWLKWPVFSCIQTQISSVLMKRDLTRMGISWCLCSHPFAHWTSYVLNLYWHHRSFADALYAVISVQRCRIYGLNSIEFHGTKLLRNFPSRGKMMNHDQVTGDSIEDLLGLRAMVSGSWCLIERS